MISFCKLLAITTFLYSLAFAQLESKVTYIPQGFNLTQLGLYGYSNSTITTAEQVSFGNPALLHDFERLAFGISRQWESPLDTAWVVGIGHRRLDNIQPQSAGLVIPIGRIHLGMGIGQKYNSLAESPPIPIISEVYPEGTGETFQILDKTHILSYSFTASTPLNLGSIFKDRLVVGARLSRSELFTFRKIYVTSLEENATVDSWAVGMMYSFPAISSKIDKIIISASFEQEAELRKLFKPDTISFLLDDSSYLDVYTGDLAHYIIGYIPKKLTIAATINMLSRLQILSEVSELLWNDISESMENQLEVSLVAAYDLLKSVKITAGVFHTDRRFSNNVLDLNGHYDTTYLTGGIGLRLWIFDVNFAVADGRWLSSDRRQQIIGNLSLGFSF